MTVAIPRRYFLAGLVGSAAAATGAYRSSAASDETHAVSTRVRLGYLGNICEAVTVTARSSSAFSNEGLTPQLVRFSSEHALTSALDAGTIDAASLNLPSLIRALDHGSRLRIVAGLHSGCMSVLARDAFAFYRPLDLKGQTIGTDQLDGPAMQLFMAILRKSGLDPSRDVGWRAYGANEFDSALRANEVNCIAVSDPIAYELQTARRVEPFLDSAGGGFSCGDDIATSHQCFLALAGAVVDRRAALAASLTRAYLNGSAAFGGGVEALQLDRLSELFPTSRNAAAGILASYEWHATTDFVVEEIELTARDFKRAGLLQTQTDPMALAQRAAVDIQNV